MPELVKDVLIGLGTSLFIERAPQLANAIVRISTSMLPAQLQARYHHDWTSTLAHIDGNLSKLGAALQILIGVPSLRKTLGLSPISGSTFLATLCGFNLLLALGMMALHLSMNGLAGKPTPEFLAINMPALWVAYLSGIALGVHTIWSAWRQRNWNRMLLTMFLLEIVGFVFLPSTVQKDMGKFTSGFDASSLPMFISVAALTLYEITYRRARS